MVTDIQRAVLPQVILDRPVIFLPLRVPPTHRVARYRPVSAPFAWTNHPLTSHRPENPDNKQDKQHPPNPIHFVLLLLSVMNARPEKRLHVVPPPVKQEHPPLIYYLPGFQEPPRRSHAVFIT